MKNPVLIVILLGIIAGAGYYGFSQYRATQANSATQAIRQQQASRDQQAAQQAQLAAKVQAAAVAKRQEIETALKVRKVSSIMPGQPGIVIIDKHEYAEGEDLPLDKGRKARVTRVQEDGVLLACEGLTFRLDPPAAPDLAASHRAP